MFKLAGCVVTAGQGKWPVVVPNFRGVDSSYWWPLEQLERANQIAQQLTRQLWRSAVQRPDPDAWPVASTDPTFILEYLDECERLDLKNVGVITCSVSTDLTSPSAEWVARVRSASSRLGIDVSFASGHYSFINSDYHLASGPLREYLDSSLNKNGLFETEAIARSFVRLHDRENELGANLETTEGALIVELWGDVAPETARRLIQDAGCAQGSP